MTQFRELQHVSDGEYAYTDRLVTADTPREAAKKLYGDDAMLWRQHPCTEEDGETVWSCSVIRPGDWLQLGTIVWPREVTP